MSIKQQFPFFSNNPDIVYLDSAATTQKPNSVIEAITQFYTHSNANAHRGNYTTANEVTTKYEAIRNKVAHFIHAPSPQDIIWTKGTTDAINLLAKAWGDHNINPGDYIVVLGSEHHANFVPWQQLAKAKQANFKTVNILPDGSPDLEHYELLLRSNPKLVAIQHCSNALGNIQPVHHLLSLARDTGATTLVDGAQAIAHIPVNVSDLGCDFYVFSAHKMYGPMGLGVLYISNKVKQNIQPYQFGGEMIERVSIEETLFRPIPALLETGTQNISAIFGLSAAIDFIESSIFQYALKNKTQLFQYLIDELKKINEVQLFGNTEKNIGVASFKVLEESTADVSALLSEQNIAIRTGHHCAMPLMQALKVDGTHRVSLGIYNDKTDVDRFISALKSAIELLN
ncbi:MAG: cysteine desulfurase [Gammaproteobacteria bacterium]|nr:cysteine desulfurase [Gammaproteobacteria bacterium]